MICGIDEAGRGPVIGPMVVAGVLVEDNHLLEKIGVKDSKKLTPMKREGLYKEIVDKTEYKCIQLPAHRIDELMKSQSLNQIEVTLFAEIIDELCPKHSTVYVDAASVDEDRFGRDILREISCTVKMISKHGADDIYPAVSAASIIAKVERDMEIKRIAEEMNQDIGSGYPSDKNTMDFLTNWVNKHGELPDHTRHAWKTSQKILDMNKTKKLDDF